MLLTLMRRGWSSLQTPLISCQYEIVYIIRERELPSEVLDRGLATRVRGVVAGKGTEKSSDNGDDLSTIRDVLSSFLQNKEGSLGVDSAPC